MNVNGNEWKDDYSRYLLQKRVGGVFMTVMVKTKAALDIAEKRVTIQTPPVKREPTEYVEGMEKNILQRHVKD